MTLLFRCSRRLAGLLVAACMAPASAAPDWLQGPYQDVSQGLDAADARMPGLPWTSPPAPGRVLVWAFATGDCANERWGEVDTARFARVNVAAFDQAGRDFIVSTGGEAGGFTCDSPEALARFVARYASPRLRGIDFDLERQQTPAQIGALVRAAASLQRAQPALRISFTLATHAGSDGTLRSLNATGELVMAAIAAAGLDTAVINLMVMNYGPPDPRWCVVQGRGDQARCDMGASALQAARNVAAKYRWPKAQIALTAMLGENDVAGNVFTLADADTLLRGARELGLAGVHWWSQGRDRPCPAGSPRVSPSCHGLSGGAAGDFAARLGARLEPAP